MGEWLLRFYYYNFYILDNYILIIIIIIVFLRIIDCRCIKFDFLFGKKSLEINFVNNNFFVY